MRGTKNKEAYKLWKEGRAFLPVTSQANFTKCLDMAKAAVALDGKFSRGLGRLAYLYTTGVVDDWDLSGVEAGWSDARLLREAEKLARKAVKLDPHDYDTHWALAFVCLNRGNVRASEEAYAKALELNDNNMNLLAERAEALIFAGKFTDAIQQIIRARRVWDWHRWVLAWAYFCKGREDKIFYSLAHDELRQMVTHPYEDNYPKEILLLSAAIHIQLKKVRQAKADMKQFLGGEKDWNIRKEMKSIKFKKRADEKHWLDALRKAGLPA